MTPPLNPMDELHQAHRPFQAADLAVSGLSLDHERSPMSALMYEALEKMESGLNLLPMSSRRSGGDNDLSAISKFNMQELFALRESSALVSQFIAALLCQPRFHRDQHDGGLNKAGYILETISDMLDDYAEAAVDAAKAARPDNWLNVDRRYWTILTHEVSLESDFSNLAELAAEATAAVEAAQVAEGFRA